jgi:hypothetical protein
MKFHAVILTGQGDVTAKTCHDSDVLAQDGVHRQMMDDSRNVLRENLTDDPIRCGKFRAKFGEGRPGTLAASAENSNRAAAGGPARLRRFPPMARPC